jgi:hypothetical protein
MNILRDTINLIKNLEDKDFIFFSRFAEYCKAEGKYVAAGHNYKAAADATRRNEISYMTYNPPIEPYKDWDITFTLLQEATSSFQLGGESRLASECYIESMQLKLLHSSGRERFWLQLHEITWGWGERPLRVVISAAICILAYSIFYFFSSIEPPAASQLDKIINCLYFSVITFSTIGYGDLHPASNLAKIVSASEGLFGIFFTGLFLVTFVKRNAR